MAIATSECASKTALARTLVVVGYVCMQNMEIDRGGINIDIGTLHKTPILRIPETTQPRIGIIGIGIIIPVMAFKAQVILSVTENPLLNKPRGVNPRHGGLCSPPPRPIIPVSLKQKIVDGAMRSPSCAVFVARPVWIGCAQRSIGAMTVTAIHGLRAYRSIERSNPIVGRGHTNGRVSTRLIHHRMPAPVIVSVVG